jgi:hypothetical protein
MQQGTRKVRTPEPRKLATSPLTTHHPHSLLTTTSKGTHPHRCERLLTGWIVGANSHINNNGGTMMTPAPRDDMPPATMPTSSCS